MPIAAEGEVSKPYSKSSAKFKKLENLHNKLHIQKKELLAKPENHSLEKAMIITKKILWHVQIIGIGIATIDMLNEGEKHDQLIKHMDDKVDHVKKALNSKIFDMRLTDLKTKFLVIKNIFDLVIQMSDDFDFEEVSADETNLKKSRLDSAFVMCEEIFLLISEPHCELYKAAHRCIDIVSCFIIVHLGMLHMAVEWYNLRDYQERLEYWMEFYPILVKSYVQQAIKNYVKPIILNYHNQYSSYEETEEIYYEMTDYVVYNVVKNESHRIWDTDQEKMHRDRMYYDFDVKKLHVIEPAYMIGPETPVLCRALRYGVAIKLEDLYCQYFNGIDQVVHKLKTSNQELESVEFNAWDGAEEMKCEFDKENIDISPIKNQKYSDIDDKLTPQKSMKNSVTGMDTPSKLDTTAELNSELVSEDNYHYKQWVKAINLRSLIVETRNEAKLEQSKLLELFNSFAKDVDYDNWDFYSKIDFLSEFTSTMESVQEEYQNLSNYIIFENENQMA